MSKTDSTEAETGVAVFSSDRFVARLASDFASQPGAAAFRNPTSSLALLIAGEPRPGGRGEHRLLPDSDWGRALRLRPARRGGALASLLGDRFLRPDRTLAKFDRTLALRGAGVPVAETAFDLDVSTNSEVPSLCSVLPSKESTLNWRLTFRPSSFATHASTCTVLPDGTNFL